MTTTDPDTRTDDPRADLSDAPAGYAGGGGYAEWASSWGNGPGMSPMRRWGGLVALLAGVLALYLWTGVGIVVAIAAIVVSIFLHELGHFLTAKWAGMKVTEFFIGFGPRIWSFHRGETEYGIKVVPAGAYVRIIGMHNLEEVDPADEDRTYRVKPYPKRLAVILAGPLMNIGLAFVLLFGVYALAGVPDRTRWTVGTVTPGSAADNAGIESGDRMVAVDGRPVDDFSSFGAMLPDSGPVTFTVERDGRVQDVPAVIGWRLDGAAAAALPGLAARDRVNKVGDVPVGSYQDLRDKLAAAQGPTTLEVERGGFLYAATVDGPVSLPEQGFDGFFGISGSPPERVPQSPAAAAGGSLQSMGNVVTMSGKALGSLFSPSGISNYADTVVSAADGSDKEVKAPAGLTLIGPAPGTPADRTPGSAPAAERPVSIVGIVFLLDDASELGWANAIELLAIVNLSLGLINLIPLLPFDGGHAAVATYEAVRSRKGRPYRVDIAKLLPITYAVVGVMVVFGLTSIFLDIRSPITMSP